MSETCEVTVHLHASLIDIVGDEQVRITLTGGSATVGDIRERLVAMHPRIKGLVPQCRWAVDMDLVTEQYELSGGQRVDILPPFSGG